MGNNNILKVNVSYKAVKGDKNIFECMTLHTLNSIQRFINLLCVNREIFVSGLLICLHIQQFAILGPTLVVINITLILLNE